MDTHRYVALLRAVNVGGHSIIRMADLVKLFESLDFENVSTYIQSGNVLFETGEADREGLAGRIEDALFVAVGREVRVFVLTGSELDAAASHNPFLPALEDPDQKCVLVFLSHEPEPQRAERLMSMQGEEYRFGLWDKVFYYTYHKKDAMTRRTIDFEKILGVSGTSRAWKVVERLRDLLG